ncbi:MAG: hypothetical protein GY906_13365 [bacterium]|nr:hypothetical protein [bacterium]
MSSEAGPTSGTELIDGILAGQVPRQVRLFAAQGLLPVSREDLLRLQLLLSTDRDEELAEIAATSVREIDETKLLDVLTNYEFEPIELDLLVRLREEESIWTQVASSPDVSDDTLRILALHGGGTVQDVIVTNQVRLLGCLELLEDLRSNENATKVILRRVREFEEEFIRKVIDTPTEELEEMVEPGPTLEPHMGQLKAIDASIPLEEELCLPESEDRLMDIDSNEQRNSAFTRILLLNIHGKIMLALKGSKEDRSILVNSQNRMVQRAVVSSPKLSDIEVERFATSRSVSEEIIRLIATNNRFVRKYPIVLALTQNPKTPVRIAMQLISRLNIRDIGRVSKDRNANPVVRRYAEKMWVRRR